MKILVMGACAQQSLQTTRLLNDYYQRTLQFAAILMPTANCYRRMERNYL